jgi:gamma-glutamyltranspeptidase
MWGCLGRLLRFFTVIFLVLFLLIAIGWWYVGSANFAEYVKNKIEATLEAKLERDVAIGSVEFVRTRPQKIISKTSHCERRGTVAPHRDRARGRAHGGVQSPWAAT